MKQSQTLSNNNVSSNFKRAKYLTLTLQYRQKLRTFEDDKSEARKDLLTYLDEYIRYLAGV